MSRQIKFRGQTIDTNEWVYGSLIQDRRRYGSRYSILSLAQDEESEDIKHEVYFPTVGQFTGLQDINGEDIFEGDRVECWMDGERVGEIDTIEFKLGAYWFRHRDISLNEWVKSESFEGEFKIIGNIYKD